MSDLDVKSKKRAGFERLTPSNPERVEYDRYWTPLYVTMELMKRVKFNGSILEPANGMGHVSYVLEQYGYSVEKSDIVTGQDFLQRTEFCDNIVTNPPYGLLNEFLCKAIEITGGKIAMMCGLHALTSKKRFAIFEKIPHCHIIIFSNAIMVPGECGWRKGGAFTHCWMIMDMKSRKKANTFEWCMYDQHYPLDPPLDGSNLFLPGAI